MGLKNLLTHLISRKAALQRELKQVDMEIAELKSVGITPHTSAKPATTKPKSATKPKTKPTTTKPATRKGAKTK